ncbi:MAG: LuxR C-terminal-related transcriptional regulator [Thiogranum sp.]|jgi:DNA-binding NarL/FixJ family response regulator|nr:LuxR C-terminal-related transcriptional regulator [Thiogranum sp.]
MTRFKESAFILLLSLIVATNLYDLLIDYSHNASAWHLLEESLVVLASTAAIVWLVVNVRRQQRELEDLKRELRAGADSVAKVAPAVLAARRRLSEVIQEQFSEWQLTTGEQEVALLLLKGLSFKEIAALRNTLEKTVRQQASGIYRKAGVSGRHAFAAWFIEDFL